jgi:hypothetical protein
MTKKFICIIFGHKIEESSCPYTLKTYQTCLRCGLQGIKENHNPQ